MTTDFCPWANRFVYWLKEPIGWFVLATVISATVGLYVNPIGWTLAASLLAIIAVGMVWPLIAVYGSSCRLEPEFETTQEESNCRMLFSVANRLPVPVWGLSVEQYFDQSPTVALSSVPPLSTAEFGIEIRPRLRGHYPQQTPQVACSFPFGIWTARRPLQQVAPLTVWPQVFEIAGVSSLAGRDLADEGEGQRGGRSGDFVGIRGFRRGDSAKFIHWIASVRTDSLVVTERGGPECAEVSLWLDTSESDVELLACQVRVAASIAVHFQSRATPMRVVLGDRPVRFAAGSRGRRHLLDALAAIPATGSGRSSRSPTTAHGQAGIRIQADPACQRVLVLIDDPRGGRRAGGVRSRIEIDPMENVSGQMERLWREVNDVHRAA